MPYEKSVLVPLGADETFALITQPDRLRRWQAITARVDLRAGGTYRWTIIPGHTVCGSFTEVEPGKRVVFSWGWEDSEDLPPGASTVIVTLEPADGGTLVRLVHEGLTGEQAASHAEGWSHYLGRLVEAARLGDAGADDWAAVPQPLDAISSAEATLAVCQLVLRGIPESAYSAPTVVCPKFTIAELADHLIGSVQFFGYEAGAQFPGTPATTLEARVATVAQPTLEAWHARGLDGMLSLGPHPMPAATALGILSIEFLVHAWDFARATGQQVTVSDELTEHVLGIAHTIITPEARRGGASFADAVPVDAGAHVLDRLIAYTGRAA
jgi:uncharacterized protein (TIGR03086 family)